MSKKEITADEKIKKHCKEIVFVGIIYAVLQLWGIIKNGSDLLADPLSLVLSVGVLVVLVLMCIGTLKRKKIGIISGWIFEVLLVLSLAIAIFTKVGSFGIIELIVLICMPFELVGYSKALKELK